MRSSGGSARSHDPGGPAAATKSARTARAPRRRASERRSRSKRAARATASASGPIQTEGTQYVGVAPGWTRDATSAGSTSAPGSRSIVGRAPRGGSERIVATKIDAAVPSGLPAIAWKPTSRARRSRAPRVGRPDLASIAIAGRYAQAPKWFQNADSDAANPEPAKTAAAKRPPESDTPSCFANRYIPQAATAKWKRRNRIAAAPDRKSAV